MTESTAALRAQLVRILDWEEAHVGFDKAIDGIPENKRGSHAEGFEHSLWQLLEHLRLAQHDILDFCANAHYVHSLTWPDDYWPRPAPPSAAAWDESVATFKAEREELKNLVLNTGVDLFANVPTGKGPQTYLPQFCWLRITTRIISASWLPSAARSAFGGDARRTTRDLCTPLTTEGF